MRKLHFIKPLGSGAVGTVYLAELEGTQGFHQQLAAKVVLSNHSGGEFLSRIRDEARLLGLLRDDNILKVLELATVEDRDVVLMEYVEGEDLATVASAKKVIPARALAELGAAVAGALHRAHTAVHPSLGTPLNVIHRDVKPANVMVTCQGTVKLLDFGVARAHFSSRESHTGQLVLGTLNYMAPEYIITGDVTSAADIYGLGVVLCEAATCTVLGQPKIRRERFEQRISETLSLLPATHVALIPVLQAMLAWEPSNRPTGAAVERALLDSADILAGASLRSWANTVIPELRALRPAEQPDTVGLAGRTFTLDEQPSHAPEPALAAPAPAPPPPLSDPRTIPYPPPTPPPAPVGLGPSDLSRSTSSAARGVATFQPRPSPLDSGPHAPRPQERSGLYEKKTEGVALEMLPPPAPRPRTDPPRAPLRAAPAPPAPVFAPAPSAPRETRPTHPEPLRAPQIPAPPPAPSVDSAALRPHAQAPAQSTQQPRPERARSSSTFGLILKSLLVGAGFGLLIVIALAIFLIAR